MADRRRINGPAGGTAAPTYSSSLAKSTMNSGKPRRSRPANGLRKMFLKTGVTPSASGSAYLEMGNSKTLNNETPTLTSLSTSSLKLICTVHGPRPLPKSAPFSPHIILTTHIKYAVFATRKRRGYLRDRSERDLGAHLDTALRGMIIGDRWPKSGVEVIVTILEGDEDQWWREIGELESVTRAEWGLMTVLGACITVASAAIADAGIDCVDVVSGGVAAITRDGGDQTTLLLDPVPSEHEEIIAACVIAYSPARDEITDIWARGDIGHEASSRGFHRQSLYGDLTNNAVQAAVGTHRVLIAALKETADLRVR